MALALTGARVSFTFTGVSDSLHSCLDHSCDSGVLAEGWGSG